MSTALTYSPNILSRNLPAAAAWNAGGSGYERISRQIADAIEHCVDRLDPAPGEQILDVATGTGWTARRIQARGANTTGLDLGDDLIDAARQLDASRSINFLVGDAEQLPFDDGTFDAVASTFGVMFCGNPEAAASELARVCRPNGRLALAIWADHDGVYELFQVISRHKPKGPAAPSPFAWANQECLDRWLGDHFDLTVEKAISYHREKTPADAWQAFAEGYGPVKSLIAKLDDAQLAAFREDFERYHANRSTPAGVFVERPYLVVSGTRKPVPATA